MHGTIKYSYSTAAVNGSTFVGGISGYVYDDGKVENSTALNPSVSNNGGSEIGRVTGGNSGSLTCNYSFSGMKANGQNISNGSGNDKNGKDIIIARIFNPAFWTESGNWGGYPWSSSAWIFENDKLPILKDLPGQSGGGGVYLMERDTQYATVTLDKERFTYDGSPHRPAITVTFNGEELREGSPYAYTGTPVFTLSSDGSPINIESFTVLYQSTDGGGYSSATASTNAGEYLLTISVPESSDLVYAGSQSYPFTIEKRPVTVRADDKTITRGETLPTFTYTVEGELPGETALVGTPTLICKADGKETGSYPITVDLAGVSYTANYTAADTAFVNGTLTVNPSSGGGGGSPGVISDPVEIPETEITVYENIVTGTTTAKGAFNYGENATIGFSQAQVSDTIDKTMRETEKRGEGYISRVVFKAEAPENAVTIQASIPKEAISQAAKSGISSLTISTPVASVTFDSSTFSTLMEEATGNIKFTVSRVEASSLSPEAQRLVGDRPVFDFNITSGGKVISQFGGDVTVSVPYTPKEGEDINAIVNII